MFSTNKTKLKNALNKNKGKKDWQCNILEELLSMREYSHTANLDKKEIETMIYEIACV